MRIRNAVLCAALAVISTSRWAKVVKDSGAKFE